MIQKIVNSIAWAIAFGICSAFIIGFLSVFVFRHLAPDRETFMTVDLFVSLIVPQAIGIIGLTLGLLGKLPGTKLKEKPAKSNEPTSLNGGDSVDTQSEAAPH